MAWDVSIMNIFIALALVCSFINAVICETEQRLITKSVHLDEVNYYFELVEPEIIRYLYKIRPSRGFGININRTYHYVPLVPVEPWDGCSSAVTMDLRLKGAVAFVERGGCSFLTKTLNAEEAGAVAVIIADNDHSNDDKMIDMIEDGTDRDCNIPAFFLLGKDGYIIHQTLMDLEMPGALINLPVNITGLPIRHINQPPWSLW